MSAAPPNDHNDARPHPHGASPGHESHGTTAHTGHGTAGAHNRHHGRSMAMFRDRVWITLLLSIPTLLWSGMVQHMFRLSAPVFPGSAYIPPRELMPALTEDEARALDESAATLRRPLQSIK